MVISVRFLVNIARRAASNCTHARAGQAEAALHLLSEALATVEDMDERMFEAELHRIIGDVLLLRLAHMERERGKSQTDMPVRANHHQHAAQFATAVSN